MRVLVVDDDPAVRATVTELLKGFGHTVIEATSAEQGLELLAEESVDFIISDWNMAGMTGVDFLSAVRTDPRTKDIPFIIITSPGSDEVQKIEAAVGARVDAYVVKPFRGEILNSKITEVLVKKTAAAVPRGGVLVVDDDDQARKIIIEIVELLGHSPIFEATDGAEGFDLLKAHAGEIGLVISDWDMPKLAGNKLLRKIRSDQEVSKIPFIMVTSQTSIEQMKLMEAINAQVSHYLMKPFTIKDLEAKINVVLSRANSASKTHQSLNQAAAAYQDGRINEARTLYRETIKVDPKNVAAVMGLADTYLRDGEATSFDEAVALLKKAIHIAPKSDAPHIALALAFEHAKSLERAIQILQDAAKQLPGSADIQYQLGRLSLRRGHVARSMEYLNKSLKLNPDLTEADKLLKEAKKKAR